MFSLVFMLYRFLIKLAILLALSGGLSQEIELYQAKDGESLKTGLISLVDINNQLTGKR